MVDDISLWSSLEYESMSLGVTVNEYLYHQIGTTPDIRRLTPTSPRTKRAGYQRRKRTCTGFSHMQVYESEALLGDNYSWLASADDEEADEMIHFFETDLGR